MSVSLQQELGTITYSEDFLKTIAGCYASECYGVIGMSQKRATDGIVELIGRKENVKRGVVVHSDGGADVTIDIYIMVEYGVSIATVCSNIISTVKYNFERVTGINVSKVNVVVTGIRV